MYSKLFLSAILLAAPLITEGKYAADSSDDSKVIISTDKSSWTIRGKVIDAQTGEEIIGAAVMVKDDPGKWAVSGLEWIDDVLSGADEDWVLVVGHHPIYAYTDKSESERTDLQKRLDKDGNVLHTVTRTR